MSKKFAIPEALRGRDIADENFMATFTAADKYGKHLSKAEANLTEAHHLAATLRGFLCNEDTDPELDECITADTVVELIEKSINKARDLLSRHSTRHRNLFVAYHDLKGGAS